jgi:hypothetical protein
MKMSFEIGLMRRLMILVDPKVFSRHFKNPMKIKKYCSK